METNNENHNAQIEEENVAPITDKTYIASIDIGTAYSGCAFSDKNDYKTEPLNITVVQPKGYGYSHYEKMKQPTTILFNKEKQFHSFGFIAESYYADALQSQEKFDDSEWFYFKQIKMCLYGNQNVSIDMIIKEKCGKEMKAMDVFKEGIRYLKDEVVEMINIKKGYTPITEIMFVLTTPAIWNEPAKQIIQEAAEQAGIPKEQLILALEPEAAALYCKELWNNGKFGKHDAVVKRCMEPGGRYFVLDLGGGTIDTTVHERKENGNLIEIHKATGGPWGGCKVNDNLFAYIDRLYGKEAVRKMRQYCPLDCLEFENNFEAAKRALTVDKKNKIRLRVPERLRLFSNMRGDKDTFIDPRNYIPNDYFMGYFDSCVEQIDSHIQSVRGKVDNVEMMLLVGGFSESKYVQEKLQSANKEMKIIVPGDSSLAVLKGAVLFGYRHVSLLESVDTRMVSV